MTFGQAIIAFLMFFFCSYLLIHRVCNCIENCVLARALSNAAKINQKQFQDLKNYYEHYKQQKAEEKATK